MSQCSCNSKGSMTRDCMWISSVSQYFAWIYLECWIVEVPITYSSLCIVAWWWEDRQQGLCSHCWQIGFDFQIWSTGLIVHIVIVQVLKSDFVLYIPCIYISCYSNDVSQTNAKRQQLWVAVIERNENWKICLILLISFMTSYHCAEIARCVKKT